MVALVKEIGIEKFREQFADSPSVLAWLEATFADANAALLKALLEEVDESHYSLRQWVDALVVLGHWLDAHGFTAELQDQIGYASCACDAAGAGVHVAPLSSLVSEMLDAYGFERAVKK